MSDQDVLREIAERNEKWDRRFLSVARLVASWSKDPSTQTGAVITDPDMRIVSTGFNGLAKGLQDLPERLNDRELKYKIILHSERNALLFARRDLRGCTLYQWPFACCSTCASMVIQSGITRVVAPPCPQDKLERWGQDLQLSRDLFLEAGLVVRELEP